MNSKMNLNSVKPYLLPIIALVVLVVLLPLVILPWFGDVRTNWSNVGTQQTKLSALQTKADALDKVNGPEKKKILEEQVEPAMPSEADPAGALGTIEQLASVSGVSPKGVSYGQSTSTSSTAGTSPSAATTGGAVEVNLSVEGNYANIVNFISQSESVARVISISSLHIVPSSTSGGSGQLTATIDVTAPYQPMLTNLGPTESPLPELTDAKIKTLSTVNKLHQAGYAATPLADINGRPSPF